MSSVGGSIIQLHRALGDLAGRVMQLEGASDASVRALVEERVEAVLGLLLDVKVEGKVAELLDRRLDGVVAGKLDATLDGRLDARLDARVTAAIKRERAFLEAAIADKVTKAVLDVANAKVGELREKFATLEASVDGLAQQPAPAFLPAPAYTPAPTLPVSTPAPALPVSSTPAPAVPAPQPWPAPAALAPAPKAAPAAAEAAVGEVLMEAKPTPRASRVRKNLLFVKE